MSNGVRNMQVGNRVMCPADRGDRAYWGRITYVGEEVHRNSEGVPYKWVRVHWVGSDGRGAVWPSHRLGFNLLEDV